MASVWIVHRDPERRQPLARLAGAGPHAVLAGPGDPELDAAPAPEAIVLAVVGDFERELEFAHRAAARHAEAAWFLLAAPADVEEARRLFDTLPAAVLSFPGDASRLRRRLAAVRYRRRAQALSERRARDAVAARFARWFEDLELPGLLRALDPKLAGVPLLARGEPGTGRGLLASYVHTFAGAEGARLLRIACQGLDAPGLLAEITRAAREPEARRGLTICLDEVETLSLPTQRQLRDWIESGLPPAAQALAPAVRWIASAADAGPADPVDSLDLGLAQALAALEVRIPPLRARPDAIAAFAERTAAAWCAAHGEVPRRLSPQACALLEAHPWPGNLRELEGVVVRTLAGGCSQEIGPGELRFEGPGEEWPESVRARPGEDRDARDAIEVISAPEALGATARPPRVPDATPAPVATPLPEPEVAPEPEPVPPTPGASEESVRRIFGAVAHEIRNPLVAIRTFSQLLPERFDDPEFRTRFAEIVGDDVRRIERAVDRLSRFSSIGTPDRKPVDVSALLETLLEERRDEIQARRLVVLRELERERPEALGDAGQLRFALEALLGKALELVPERGDVYVASRHHADGPGGGPCLRVLLRFQSPDEVLPTGVEGISLAETALEVVLADAIVRSQGGVMSARSSDGRETVILIDLAA
jgi:DNA-binding NtrC family response regulator